VYFESENEELVSAFFEIEEKHCTSIVSYYEAHLREISLLEPYTQYQMLDLYAESIYELEDYGRYLEVVDEIIETSIIENWQYLRGRDVYISSLKCKAYALYRTDRFKESAVICSEIYKIKEDAKVSKLLYKCTCHARQKMFAWPRFVFITAHSLILYVLLQLLVLYGCLSNYYVELKFDMISRNYLIKTLSIKRTSATQAAQHATTEA